MKKLTNKSDTKDALEAFGLEVVGDEHITSKGNLKGVVRNEAELISNIDKVYEYWQQRGFPYYSTDEQYREEQFKALQSTNFKKLLTKNAIFRIKRLI